MLTPCPTRIAKNRRQKSGLLILIAISLIIGAVMISGCGKKAPPVSPYFYPLPKVAPEYEVMEEKTLKITWPIPMRNGTIYPKLQGFKVYRSKLSLTDCMDCPLRFELVKDMSVAGVNISDKDKAPQMQYLEELEMGYNYGYKIETYGKGAESKTSNIIRFNF